MSDKKLHISIVTPSKEFYEGEVEYVQIPMHDGLIGVLPEHTSLMGVLGFGLLSLKDHAGDDHFIIDGGFVEIKNNTITVLANSAEMMKNVTLESAEKALEEAMSLSGAGPVAMKLKEDSLAAARTRLRYAKEKP